MLTPEYRDSLGSQLLRGELEIWQLPRDLQELVYVGDFYGHQRAAQAFEAYIQALEQECDELYAAASRGTLTAPVPKQGLSFADLCRLRGDDAQADQVEADWQQLLNDEQLSRLDLIKEKRRKVELRV